MMENKDEKIYIMSEVSVPGMEFGVSTAEEVCTKCGQTKKDCTCKK